MTELKLAVIGGGSTYTPELIEGFAQGHLPVREIALMDIDAAKLAVVGGLAQRMAGARVRVTLTTDRAAALDGADVVITQLRVGGLAARIKDERIPLAHGLVGQETTGPGGFAKALRTIPVILAIAREMEARCPGAWLVNFTNPSGLITEALRLYGHVPAVGLCNYPLTLKMKAAEALEVAEGDLELAYFGLNHLSWARVLVCGEDRTAELIELMIADPRYRELSGYAFDPDRLRGLGLIPSGYLRYFYDRDQMVRALRAAPRTRGEQVREVEAALLRDYANPDLREKPAGLQERGGAWYSTAAVRLVHDLLLPGQAGTHVLNVPNAGANCLLPPAVIVETPARVGEGAMRSLPTVMPGEGGAAVAGVPVPAEIASLLRRVKEYELRTVEAAVTGSLPLARAALEAHPLLDGHHAVIPVVLDELLAAHREYLPAFGR